MQIGADCLTLTLTLAACRIGLAVACLTAVREVLGSNRAVQQLCLSHNRCDLQPWARVCAPFLQCLGQLSLLPSVGR